MKSRFQTIIADSSHHVLNFFGTSDRETLSLPGNSNICTQARNSLYPTAVHVINDVIN